MRDGIDHGALAAELRILPPPERKARSRQLTSWLQAAARSEKASRFSKLSAVCLLLSILLGSVAYSAGSRIMAACATSMLAPAVLLALESNRSARVWRREHPFGSWSAQ